MVNEEISMVYTTYGQVRGCCGHRHTSVETAERCITKDGRGCRMQGGYTDRSIVDVREDGRLYIPDTDTWVPGPGGRTHGAARF